MIFPFSLFSAWFGAVFLVRTNLRDENCYGMLRGREMNKENAIKMLHYSSSHSFLGGSLESSSNSSPGENGELLAPRI